MTKCSLIAHCLIKSNFVNDINFAEQTVIDYFEHHFASFSFHEWNSYIDSTFADQMIGAVTTSSSVNIQLLITELWDA